MELSTKDVIERVVANQNCAKNVATLAVEATIQAMFELLTTDDCTRLRIKNIGIFSVNERDACIRRNPRTNEPVPVEPSTGVSFRAAKRFKEVLNDHSM